MPVLCDITWSAETYPYTSTCRDHRAERRTPASAREPTYLDHALLDDATLRQEPDPEEACQCLCAPDDTSRQHRTHRALSELDNRQGQSALIFSVPSFRQDMPCQRFRRQRERLHPPELHTTGTRDFPRDTFSRVTCSTSRGTASHDRTDDKPAPDDSARSFMPGNLPTMLPCARLDRFPTGRQASFVRLASPRLTRHAESSRRCPTRRYRVTEP